MSDQTSDLEYLKLTTYVVLHPRSWHLIIICLGGHWAGPQMLELAKTKLRRKHFGPGEDHTDAEGR